MRRLLAILSISLLVTALALIFMHATPIKANKTDPPPCCDKFILETSYGFPLPFKQVYSGGFTGAGTTTTKPSNMAIDGAIIFAATATVLSAALNYSKMQSKKFK